MDESGDHPPEDPREAAEVHGIDERALTPLFVAVQGALDQLVANEHGVRLAFVLDVNGQLIASAGDTTCLDTTFFGSMTGAAPGTLVEALLGAGYTARFPTPDVHMVEALGGSERLTRWNGVGVRVELVAARLLLCLLFDVDVSDDALRSRSTAVQGALRALVERGPAAAGEPLFREATEENLRRVFQDSVLGRSVEHAYLRKRAALRRGPDAHAHAEAAISHVRAALAPRAELEGTVEADNDPYELVRVLGVGAEVALLAGELDLARACADEIVSLWRGRPYRNPWGGLPGPHLMRAHTVLGLVALRRDDRAAALAELDRAAHAPPDCVSCGSGPRIELASALLAHGETDAVVDYLRVRATSWELDEGRTDRWVASIRAGEPPDWDELFELAYR